MLTLISALFFIGAPETEHVTLPLADWDALVAETRQTEETPVPPAPFGIVERSVVGEFNKGLLSGDLKMVVEVLTEDRVRVPVLDTSTTVGRVRLDGRQTSLLQEGTMYTAGLKGRGRHVLDIQFLSGQERDRFAREFSLRLPRGATTALSVWLPESNIEIETEAGVNSSQKSERGGTRLLAHGDSSGVHTVRWNPGLSHQKDSDAKTEAKILSLMQIGQGVITGAAKVSVRLLKGEVDRFDLQLPQGLEVVRVEGPQVLQWQSNSLKDGATRVAVLLRDRVKSQFSFLLTTQFALAADAAPTALLLPVPDGGPWQESHLGIESPPAIKVEVTKQVAATVLPLRDIPANLSSLSERPLAAGYKLGQNPVLEVATTRQGQLEMTTTVIDDLQASTVLLEDGLEVTKLRLRVRNNARQYLKLDMPADAELTHALLDGRSFRPATLPNKPNELLLPLRQSERMQGHSRFHVVGEGETLSGISNYYYSDPGDWRRIIDANRGRISGGQDVTTGMRLRIPARSSSIQESSFLLELAYKRRRKAVRGIGRTQLSLCDLDVEVLKTTWHLYLPSGVTPFRFSGNLTQLSSVRYDFFRRLRDFGRRALFGGNAWAGGQYKSILSQRKVIWQAESQNKNAQSAVVSSFPLVGDRYRFRRIFPGQSTAHVEVWFGPAWLGTAIPWVVFLTILVLASLWLRNPTRPQRWVPLVLALTLSIVVAHYFLGSHRRALWALDLALIAEWLRRQWPALLNSFKSLLNEPWLVTDWLTLRTLAAGVGLMAMLAFVLSFPLLLSSVVLGVSGLLWWRARGGQVHAS